MCFFLATATLLLGVALKAIASSKAVAHPVFLIEPSMMASIRRCVCVCVCVCLFVLLSFSPFFSPSLCSLCSILVLSIDAAIEWGNMTRDGRADRRDVSDAEMALAKLKILSYGRILADPQPKYVRRVCVCVLIWACVSSDAELY